MAGPNGELVKAIVIPTFVGSLLSCLASFTALILHITLPPKRHFRHALILNLLIADFINSLNNTISGAVVLSEGHTRNGKAETTPSCVINAWVGQFSVQAVDFNILIISIVVLLTVFRTHLLSDASQRKTILLCAAAWVPGFVTSTIGWALGSYGHVSGNWCWIRRDELALRYALTHGWRIAIFIATIVIYTVIYVRLTRVFGILRVGNTWSTFPSQHVQSRNMGDAESDDAHLHHHHQHTFSDTEGILVSQTYSISHEMHSHQDQQQQQQQQQQENHKLQQQHPARSNQELKSLPNTARPDYKHGLQHDDHIHHLDLKTTSYASAASPPHHHHHHPEHDSSSSTKPIRESVLSVAKVPAPPNVRRMLLMNGYPIAYILLWIPGMCNRLVESVNGSSPQWLTVLQASTQFVGFVNAVTYGYSEQMRRDLFLLWDGKREFLRMRS
ncbi:hypothetical protein E4U26_007041 [Claviceps purpurea]|nr:hypothetical protein E4U26_007041 [Claviceps purpurea]